MDAKKTKLGPRAINSVFVCYAELLKVYRLLNLIFNVIMESKDVEFFENKFSHDFVDSKHSNTSDSNTNTSLTSNKRMWVCLCLCPLVYAFCRWYSFSGCKTRTEVNAKLEIWKGTLKSKDFRLIKTKIEYMECKFSKNRNGNIGVVRLNGQEIPKGDNFRQIGSIIHKNWEIEENVNHKIRAE